MRSLSATEHEMPNYKGGALGKLCFHFLSHWMGYGRGDSFPFDFEPNGIPFGSKLIGKLSQRSYPIECERKWNYSFLSAPPISPSLLFTLHCDLNYGFEYIYICINILCMFFIVYTVYICNNSIVKYKKTDSMMYIYIHIYIVE